MTNEEAITTLSFLRSEYNCFDEGRERYHTLSMAIKALKQNQWIPCSERLPETNSRVLITIWGRSCEAVYDKDGDWIMAVPFIESTIYENKFRPEFITAWMPLPEPYTRGEEE